MNIFKNIYNPKVSIIVPVYNVEKYLNRCIDSLLNQSLKDIEIILVDDGSPDHCPAMCDEYAKQDHRVKVIHKKNEGQGYARNSALEIADGQYIAFVDSDDYVELNAYQKLYSIITDTKADVVYCTFRRFNDQGSTWMETSICKEILCHTKEEIRGLMLDMIANRPKAKLDRDVQVSACCALYRHDMIKQFGIKFKSDRELNGGEDMPFNLNYLLHSSSVIVKPDIFYNYRLNLSSWSHSVKPEAITKNYFYYQNLLEILRTNDFGEDGHFRATRHFLGNSRRDIRLYIQSSLSKREKLLWLKEVINHYAWSEIASSYPYRQLPLKYALHFYLLHKGHCRLLYYYSKLWPYLKSIFIVLKNRK